MREGSIIWVFDELELLVLFVALIVYCIVAPAPGVCIYIVQKDGILEGTT